MTFLKGLMNLFLGNLLALGGTFGFAINIIWRSRRFCFILLVLTTCLQGLGPSINIFVFKFVLDAIAQLLTSHGAASDTKYLITLLLIQAGLAVAFTGIGQFSSYIRMLIGTTLKLEMTGGVLRKASQLDLQYFETPEFHNMIERALGESDAKPLEFVEHASNVFRNVITFLSVSYTLTTLSPVLVPVIFLLCVPYFVVKLFYSKKLYDLEYRRTHDKRMAQNVATLLVNRKTVPEILLFGVGSFLLDKWANFIAEFNHQDLKLQRQRLIFNGFLEGLLTASHAVASGYIIFLGISRSTPLTIGEIMMFIGFFTSGTNALGITLTEISTIFEGILFLQNLERFHRLEPIIEKRQTDGLRLDTIQTIEFVNVSFTYPGCHKRVLNKLNLTFSLPEKVLVVGANGEGKSTLIKLLTRQYDPIEGEILINGRSIKEYDPATLRAHFSVAFQEFIRYPFSVADNITCGTNVSIEQVKNAARLSGAEYFIEELPNGYRTVLGKEYQNGYDLSVGQWQRLCVSRAFLRNASVLVFDEPTASLDVEEEARFLREMAAISKDKLCILVSHRLFRDGIADRIIVLEEGRVLEDGTCSELVQLNGKFAKLWQIARNSPSAVEDAYMSVSG